MPERSLAELDLRALVAAGQYLASPRHWEDKVIHNPTAAIGQPVAVEARNGKAVSLTVPAAGFVIYR
jgi:hypothetical protein